VLAAFSFEATVLETMTIADTTVPTVSAYSTAFWLSAAVAVVGALTALAVTPRGGRLEVAVEAIDVRIPH
jgi:hypothetical protein